MSCEEIIYTGAIMDLEILMVISCDPDVVLDISDTAAGTKNVILKRPDDTSVTIPALFRTDGTDGLLYITTDATHLTMSGTYQLQAYVVLTTWSGHSVIGDFEVQENLG